MAEQKETPAVKEQAPTDKSVGELMGQDDAEWAKSFGVEVKPEEKKEPAKKEEKKEVVVEEKPVKKVAETEEVQEEVEEETEEKSEEKPAKEFDFQVFGDEGELEVPEDLKFTFKANGKVKKDVPIEKVIQFAKMGVYNHEREQQVEQKERQAQAAQNRVAELEQVAGQLKSQLERMLDDQDYADAARERWAQYNTPEAKMQRLQVEVQRTREESQIEREATAVAAATQQYFVPAVSGLLEKNPLVSDYEVLGRFNELVGPHLVNGRLPAAKLQTVFDLIDTRLTTWAESLQEDRLEKSSAQRKETEKAQREAAAAKKRLARTVAPKGGVGPDKTAKTDFKSAKDWLDNMFPTN